MHTEMDTVVDYQPFDQSSAKEALTAVAKALSEPHEDCDWLDTLFIVADASPKIQDAQDDLKRELALYGKGSIADLSFQL